jgi:hypothetical protein
MVTAWALQAKEIVVGVTRADVARSVSAAALAEPTLRRLVRVVRVPDASSPAKQAHWSTP